MRIILDNILLIVEIICILYYSIQIQFNLIKKNSIFSINILKLIFCSIIIYC